MNEDFKEKLKSKRFWVSILTILAGFFPPAQAELAANPDIAMTIVGGIFAAGQLFNKKDEKKSNEKGEVTILALILLAASIFGGTQLIDINPPSEEKPKEEIAKEGSMMKSYYVHYKNKYPGAKIQMNEHSLDVYSQDGKHLISLAKNGAGQVVDKSAELGCLERHDLSAIPKKSRAYKLFADGNIGPSEEFEERSKWVERNAKSSPHGYKYIEPGEYEGAKEEPAPAA